MNFNDSPLITKKNESRAECNKFPPNLRLLSNGIPAEVNEKQLKSNPMLKRKSLFYHFITE